MVTKKKTGAAVAFFLHKRVTKMRARESYWVTIESVNGEPLFTSEKYVNKADALNAVNLVSPGAPVNGPDAPA